LAFALLLSSEAAALVLPAATRVAFRVPSHGLSPVMQFDEEGGMIKGIEEGGMTLDEVRASYGQEAPGLDDAKKAMLEEMTEKAISKDMTDLDFEISCSSMLDTECVFDVRPTMNTFEEYFVGLTAGSHPSFKMTSGCEGTMDRRGGEPVTVTVKCDPGGQAGELVAYVGFIFPEEKPFSTFYKITCTSQ